MVFIFHDLNFPALGPGHTQHKHALSETHVSHTCHHVCRDAGQAYGDSAGTGRL